MDGGSGAWKLSDLSMFICHMTPLVKAHVSMLGEVLQVPSMTAPCYYSTWCCQNNSMREALGNLPAQLLQMKLSEGEKMDFSGKKETIKIKRVKKTFGQLNWMKMFIKNYPKKVIDGVAAYILMDQYKWIDYLATLSTPQIKLEKDPIRVFQIILSFVNINNLIMTQREIYSAWALCWLKMCEIEERTMILRNVITMVSCANSGRETAVTLAGLSKVAQGDEDSSARTAGHRCTTCCHNLNTLMKS